MTHRKKKFSSFTLLGMKRIISVEKKIFFEEFIYKLQTIAIRKRRDVCNMFIYDMFII